MILLAMPKEVITYSFKNDEIDIRVTNLEKNGKMNQIYFSVRVFN